MNIEALRERAAAMTEAQLVWWLWVFEHMAQIEARLDDLEAGVMRGRRPSDGAVADIQEMLRSELRARILTKSGRQP